MRGHLRIGALLLAGLTLLPTARAGAPRRAGYQFGVVGHVIKTSVDEGKLRQALTDANGAPLSFVVVNGIKAGVETCSDKLYQQRRELLDESSHPLIVSLAASDWSECRNGAGRSAAVERLNRLRELLFADPSSLGGRKLALTRLSASAKFRSYAENAHWTVGKVLYATINLPSNNNHYRREAGRNSEFEDRTVANRAWLQRLFALGQRNKFEAIVLFSEGDAGMLGERAPVAGQDGFAETRRQIALLSKKFQGSLLLIDSETTPSGAEPVIRWRGNLGHVSLGANAVVVQVAPGAAEPFTLGRAATDGPAQ